jgi:flagellar secretion chaperone FliS
MSYPATIPMPAHRSAPSFGARPARPGMMSAAPGAAAGYGGQAARYREADLVSATPGQLVVKLFDKMLLTLRRARAAAAARQIEERCESLILVIDMLTELRASLDHEQGGEIAAQLDALYGFMLREVAEANRLQSVEKIDVVVNMAGELRAAFAGAVQQLAAPAAAPAARSA